MLPATRENSWTRFSAPFSYYQDRSPEYIVIVLSAGNRKNAIEGSEAWFDDLKLIYNKP